MRSVAVLPVVACPAAEPLAGPPTHGPSVVCHVLRNDRARALGHGLSAGAAGLERNSADGVLVTEQSDPSTLHRLCCGDGVPITHEDNSERRRPRSYTECPVWQAERERERLGLRHLAELPVPDAVPDAIASSGFVAEEFEAVDGGAFAVSDEGW